MASKVVTDEMHPKSSYIQELSDDQSYLVVDDTHATDGITDKNANERTDILTNHHKEL